MGVIARHVLRLGCRALLGRAGEGTRPYVVCGDFRQIFPEELSPVEHFAAAHVEEVYRQHPVFVVIAEDVGVVAFDRGDALLFLQLLHRGNQVAIFRCTLVLFGFRGLFHALAQGTQQVGGPAFEKHFHVAHRFLVDLRCGQSFHAGSLTTFDVVLQTRTRVIAREVNLAGRNHEVPVDQVHDAIRQVCRKIRTVVGAAILAQTPRDIHAGKALAQGELHVWISLVVAQQNVEARLLLLDQVVLKRQRLFIVGHDDVINVHRLAHQGIGLGILPSPLAEV